MFSSGGLNTAQINWPSVIANAALWLLLGASASAFCYQAYTDITVMQASQQPPESAPASVSPSGEIKLQQKLSEYHLFGDTTKTSAAPVQQQKIPETRLQLELRGAFTSSDPTKASALVSEKGKNSQRFYINDTLPGGAVLTQVDANHVTLSRNGRLEVLRFPKPEGRSGSKPARYNTVNQNKAPNSSRPATASSARSESIKERLERLRQNKKQ